MKLKIHRIEGERVIVDSIEAESFEDFVIVEMNLTEGYLDRISEIKEQLKDALGNKIILFFDRDLDISLYGVSEAPSFDQLELPL